MDHPLFDQVLHIGRRLSRLRLGVACCAVASVGLLAGVLLGWLDYGFGFVDPGFRWIASFLFWGVWGVAVWSWIFPLVRSAVTPLGVARRVEASFPQFNDGLASAIDFLQSDRHDRTAGSPSLRHCVIEDATRIASTLPIDTVVDRRPFGRALGRLCVALLPLVVILAISPEHVAIGVQRLAVPWRQAPWPQRHHLKFVDPPVRLAAGSDFEAKVIDEHGELPESVQIHYRWQVDGRIETSSRWMEPADNAFVIRREDVSRSFEFRAEGGDDQSMAWQRIDVVVPPEVSQWTLSAFPPPYSGLRDLTGDDIREVLIGTEMAVTGVADRPIQSARLVLGLDETRSMERQEAEEGEGTSRFELPRGEWTAETSESLLDRSDGRGGCAGFQSSAASARRCRRSSRGCLGNAGKRPLRFRTGSHTAASLCPR